MSRTCSRCGTTVELPGDEEGLPAGWSFSVEDGGIRYQCSDCIRRNIRAIEGKLPEEWWEA